MNKNGQFNVAFGHHKYPKVFRKENIRALSKLFNMFDVTFVVSSYDSSKIPDNVVYCDPPYYGVDIKYTKNKFDHEEYINFLNNIKKDCKVIHSNSTKFLEVYNGSETVEEIELWDRINSKNPGRTRTELLLLFS